MTYQSCNLTIFVLVFSSHFFTEFLLILSGKIAFFFIEMAIRSSVTLPKAAFQIHVSVGEHAPLPSTIEAIFKIQAVAAVLGCEDRMGKCTLTTQFKFGKKTRNL